MKSFIMQEVLNPDVGKCVSIKLSIKWTNSFTSFETKWGWKKYTGMKQNNLLMFDLLHLVFLSEIFFEV